MAGMTEQGLSIKRQHEIIADAKARARVIFRDLVPPGDVVDTSDSSTIGRIVGLYSVPLADLWEAVQEVYLAFDPNSARGLALDNLVMYGGLTREPASATQATVVLWGDEDTFIPAAISTVRSNNNNLYDVLTSVQLSASQCIGFSAIVSNVVVGAEYRITVINDQTSFTVTYTAQPGDTQVDIIENLKNSLSIHSFLNVAAEGNKIIVETVDIYDYIGVNVDEILIEKIKGRTEVVCKEVGAIEQGANTINEIATPILGWDSVNNPFPAILGKERETDEELRIRFRNSKYLRAQNISDALYSALLEIDGVQYVRIYENETDVYDATYDLPPHSFKPIILGGAPAEIGRVIWRNKPLGIASVGNSSTPVTDSQGFTRDIYFDRPINVPIYIDINLTIDGDDFPADGINQIKAALINYFENNFSIGDNVVYSRLYTPINSVKGHQVDSLTIGTAPSPSGTSNIAINYNEIASLDSANITITVA